MIILTGNKKGAQPGPFFNLVSTLTGLQPVQAQINIR